MKPTKTYGLSTIFLSPGITMFYTHRMFFSALTFLTGCLLGGITGYLFGLSAIVLAGIILFLATIND